jgi:hypothetical protein
MGKKRDGSILRMPETSFNNTLALPPFGKQSGFIPSLIDHGPAVSPMQTVMRN